MLATLTVALTTAACRPRVTDRDAETPETQANDRSQSAAEEEGTLDPRDVMPVPTQITDDEEYPVGSQPNGQPAAEREDTAGDQENPRTRNALQPDEEDLLKTFGVEQGVVVEDLLDDAPADQAGLQPGDVIIGAGEESIETARQLRQTIAAFDPGEEVRLTFLRNGERRQVDATLQRQPDDDQQAETKPEPDQTDTPDSISGQVLAKLGFLRLENLTPQIARRFQLDVEQGILVLGVRPYSAAAVAGIGKGHIIRRVAGERVNQIEQFRQMLQDANLRDGVRLRVKIPRGPARFAVLSLGD